MKKLYTTIFIGVINFVTLAQPVINSANVPSTLSANIIQADATGSSYGSAGGGQTWNYSTVSTLAYGTEQLIPYTGSPFASSFPTSNYCNKLNITGLGISYDYYKLNTSSLDKFSEMWDGSSGITYTNQRTVIQFPATYNSSFTDTYQQLGASSATSYTAAYDAYGTMILSFGTFANVIRQKIVENGITNYKWFNSNPFYLLVETNVINSEFKIYQNTPTGIAETENNISIILYPNPANGQFTIVLPSENADIVVTNTLGQEIIEEHATHKTMDLQINENGVYTVMVKTKDGIAKRKLVVNR